MLETSVENILESDKYTRKIFGGALAFDELPKYVKYPSCFIINNRPRSHYGEHWLALFFDEKKNAYFFDSYGGEPSNYRLEDFIERNSVQYFYNKNVIQGDSFYCGYYCVLYLLSKARNQTSEFFKFFNKNAYINDKKIKFYINKFKLE